MTLKQFDLDTTSIYLALSEHLCDESRSESERRITDDIVRQTLGDNVRMARHPSGAPYLIGSDLSVSVSHSRKYVAVAVSSDGPIGIDIEEYRDQLQRVAPRILSEDELNTYSASKIDLLRAWTLKEALYKAALTPGVDFRRDIILPLSPIDTLAFVNNKAFAISTITILDDCLLSLARPNYRMKLRQITE